MGNDKDLKLLAYMGARVRTFRKSNGICQEDLAHTLNLTRATICNIEAGKQYIKHPDLLKLCTLFNATPNDFYSKPPEIELIRSVDLVVKRKKDQLTRLEAKMKRIKEEIQESEATNED